MEILSLMIYILIILVIYSLLIYLDLNKWRREEQGEIIPNPRRDFSIEIENNFLFLFGGKKSDSLLWRLNCQIL